MPVIHVDIDQSTIVASSIASAAMAYGFCWAMDIKPGISALIAGGIGIALYLLGMVPIGLMIFVALASGGAIMQKLFSSGAEETEENALYRQKLPTSEEDLKVQEPLENTAQESAPLGRNTPCPCGSGKRYKHCCGKPD